MRDLLERALRAYKTPTGKKMVRFTMVSVISTTVSLGVLLIVFGVLHLWSQVPSALFANAVATVPAYNLNRRWTWGKTGRSHIMKEIVPFWVTSFAGLALSAAAAAAARDFTKAHGLHHFGATVVVLSANLTAYGVLWIGKLLIFSRLFHHEPIEVELADS